MRTEIPPVGHTVWLHRETNTITSSSSSELSEENRANVLTYSSWNPGHSLNFLTNQQDRIESRLADDLPGNINIAHYRDFYREHHPSTVKTFIDALAPRVPACAKDIISYIALDVKPGIFFDIDTRWKQPIPSHFSIDGKVAAYRGFENPVVAYAGDSDIRFMRDVLDECKKSISKKFSIKKTGSTVKFKVKKNDLSFVIDEVSYAPLSRTIFNLHIENSDVIEKTPLEDLLAFEQSESEQRWKDQSVGIKEISAIIA